MTLPNNTVIALQAPEHKSISGCSPARRTSHPAPPPLGRRKSASLIRNVTSNWAGLAASMAAGFLTAPFLVNTLGNTYYGLWMIVASLTGYFALLDLGVRGSLGRGVALHSATHDADGFNRTISTALALLTMAACAVFLFLPLLLLAVATFLAPHDLYTRATLVATLLVGLNVAVSLPASSFDAILWGQQRFHELNAIDIVTVLCRTAATFALVRADNGLIALALITLSTTLVASSLKALVAFQSGLPISVSINYVGREEASRLLRYGTWLSLLTITRTVSPLVAPMIVAAQLGVAIVTPYSIAVRLVGYVTSLLIAGTQVLTPVATQLHAEGDQSELRRIVMLGGKYSLALALLCAIWLAAMGKPFVELWVGHNIAPVTYPVLLLLLAGDLLPLSQWVSYSVILGMGRHRTTALSSACELLVASVCGYLLSHSSGIIGVAAAFGLCAALFRGAVPLIHVCHITNVGYTSYMAFAMVPAFMRCLPAATLLLLSTYVFPVTTWFMLVFITTAYVATYVLAFTGVLARDFPHKFKAIPIKLL